MTVGVLGTTGYTGEMLLRYLLSHPNIKKIYPVSRSTGFEKKSVKNSLPFFISDEALIKIKDDKYISFEKITSLCKNTKGEKIDVLFSALPHTKSAHFCSTMCSENKDLVCIDLSADFRFKDVSLYNKIYNTQHPDEKLLHHAVYGLSEWNRNSIKTARVIACPGCYATSVLLPLLPIIRHCRISGLISIVSSSGITGAGKKAAQNTLFSERSQSVQAYNMGRTHRHVPEISYYLEKLAHVEKDVAHNFVFTPQLVPITQGLVSIISVPLEPTEICRAIDALQSQYIGERWIKIAKKENDLPDVKKVCNTNYTSIGYTTTDNALILCCVIDNLGKGAAGQAVQNFNIRFGFDDVVSCV